MYVLQIKEQFVLSQSAVDHILSSTKTLVSDILLEILDDIQYAVPTGTMQLLRNKVARINSTLFGRVSTAPMQKKYFKEHFDLVVSESLTQTSTSIATCMIAGTSEFKTWFNTSVEEKESWASCSEGCRYFSVRSTARFFVGGHAGTGICYNVIIYMFLDFHHYRHYYTVKTNVSF